MRYFTRSIFAMALFIGVLSISCALAATVTVAPTGNSTFIITGSGLTEVAGLDVTIDYDAAALSNPRATAGPLIAGAMFMANPNTPGRLRIAFATATPVSGDGTVASVTFDNNGSGPGKILALALHATDSNGAQLPVDYSIGAQPESPLSDTARGTGQDITQSQGITSSNADPPSRSSLQPSSSGKTFAGVATTQPGGDGAREENGQREPSPQPSTAPAPDDQPAPAPSEKEQSAAPVVTPSETATDGAETAGSVLERFRDYRGEQSIIAFTALFKDLPHPGITQEPMIALSDGTSKVTLHITGQNPFSYSLKNAKRLSLKKTGEDSWQLEVVPDKGTCSAILMFRHGNSIMRFPLTVAPPIGRHAGEKAEITEKDFAVYLKERAKGSTRFDLNNDGVTDYIDDYIFTANYLATGRNGAGQKLTGTGKK